MAEKNSKILNFVQKRQANIELKRRQFERIYFQNILGIYSVLDEAGSITPIEMIDISKHGCLVRQQQERHSHSKTLKKGSEITMRMYFTKNSFIPIVAKVKHEQEHRDEQGRVFHQFGLEFDTSMSSFEALQSFIDFLYKFAEVSVVDKGDRKIHFL